MPKAKENPIYLYWDKALLLLLAAVGVYVFLGRVVSSPIKIEGAGQSKMTPDQLVDDLYQDAKDLQDRINRARPEEIEATDYAGFIRGRLDETLPDNLPRNPLTFKGAGVKELAREESIVTPAVLSPKNIRGRAAIGLIHTGSETSRSRTQPIATSGRETHWITVAAEFPFHRQYLAFAGLDPLVAENRRLEENDQRFVFARLDLQRQELQADGSWSKAEDVNAYELFREGLPTTVENLGKLYSLSADEESSENARALREWLSRDGFQEFIVRPEFFYLTGFEQWYWPEEPPDLEDERNIATTLAGPLPTRDESPKYRDVSRARTTTDRGRTTVADRAGFPGGLPGENMVMPPVMAPGMAPGTQPRTTSTSRSRSTSAGRSQYNRGQRIGIRQDYRQETIQMWAHDSTVVPGATYRYRMRVLLYNPLCGHELAASGKVRESGWLEGPWSGWSEPVETMKKQSFYFTGVSPARGSKPPRARVTVYAWQDGWWYENLFFYSDAGSMIGSIRDVPHFAMSEAELPRTTRDARGAASRRTRPVGTGARAKVKVDFTTGWSIVNFKPEVQLDQPVNGESADAGTVTTAELEVKEQTTGRVEKRYVVIDSDNIRRKEVAEIVARQEAAFKEMRRESEAGRSRSSDGLRRPEGGNPMGPIGPMPGMPR